MAAVRVAMKGMRARVDYDLKGMRLTELFESVGGKAVVKTSFNGGGEVLSRELVESTAKPGDMAAEFAERLGWVEAAEFAEIEVLKRCPKCGGALAYEAVTTAAVLPVLICSSCKARSFSLTDSYLLGLVNGNRELFDDNERRMLDERPKEFMEELRGHIIRIYASKHVSRI